LLQVLQDREFQRIGGNVAIRVDVRIIAATHRGLEEAIADGTFRDDLYYRLNVVNIHLPPLRERKEDILPMAEYLLAKHAIAGSAVAMTPELKHAMLIYHWPGNVRELENMARRLIVLRDPALLARELYAKATRKPIASNSTAIPLRLQPRSLAVTVCHEAPILEHVTTARDLAESEAILSALQFTHLNRKQAATLLKIDYKALLYKMKKLGLEDDALAPSPQDQARALGGNGR